MSAKPPVRILALTYAEDSQQNAQQLNVREMAKRLDPERFELTLLFEGEGTASVGDLPHVRLLRIGRRFRSARILRALFGRRFDILFHPHAGWPEAVYARFPRWFPGRGARILVPVEGDQAQLDEVEPWLRGRLERLYRRADALLPITEHVAESLRRRVGRDGEVIPVGVDVESFRPRTGPRRPGPLRVLSVGKLKAWKRPELTRHAAEHLPALEFLWVGDGELLESERRLAPKNLRHAGVVRHESLPDAYRDADILLHPSRMEGLPKVVLEALASGVPVVAFDDYRPDYLTRAGAGLVVSSEMTMVDALRTLATDEALRAKMSEAARGLAMTYTWESVTRRWEQVFEREAARRRGRRDPAA